MAGSASSPYYNTGSCVHPSGITEIEIEKRCLTLVKWSVKARKDMALYADREVLGEPVSPWMEIQETEDGIEWMAYRLVKAEKP